MTAGQTRAQSTKTSSNRQHEATKPDSQNTHLLKPDQAQNFPSIPSNLCIKSNPRDSQNYRKRNQSNRKHRTSRPVWCRDEEEGEGLEEDDSSPPASATGMRSSRSLSLSLLPIAIGDFSSPITRSSRTTPSSNSENAERGATTERPQVSPVKTKKGMFRI